MSVAKTEPHYLFDLRPGFQTDLVKISELYAWDDMRTKNRLDTASRAVRDEKYCAHAVDLTRSVGKENGAKSCTWSWYLVNHSSQYRMESYGFDDLVNDGRRVMAKRLRAN